ncbi:MAG: hypothetical protein KDI49_17970 [Gammaproteobacteria bacterium]|nr:hypothetical protein [Gammaproteobacteria bacterium]
MILFFYNTNRNPADIQYKALSGGSGGSAISQVIAHASSVDTVAPPLKKPVEQQAILPTNAIFY